MQMINELTANFNKCDREGKGSITRDEVVPLIMSNASSVAARTSHPPTRGKALRSCASNRNPDLLSLQIYAPNEDEITNTMKYLSRGEAISRDDFVMGYHRVAQAMGGPASQLALCWTARPFSVDPLLPSTV